MTGKGKAGGKPGRSGLSGAKPSMTLEQLCSELETHRKTHPAIPDCRPESDGGCSSEEYLAFRSKMLEWGKRKQALEDAIWDARNPPIYLSVKPDQPKVDWWTCFTKRNERAKLEAECQD
jgi:hypothetical protein